MSNPVNVMRKALGLTSSKPVPQPEVWGEGTGVLTHYPRQCNCDRCPYCGQHTPWWRRPEYWPPRVPSYTY